ncbi:MAG: hydroxymethylbilane synthase [Rhodothermales bacterium]
MKTDAPLVLGTRRSALALWQANHVRRALEEAGHAVVLEEIVTTGDRIQDVPLAKIGDKALFTKELDRALLDGRIHLAVHSLKDLPTTLPEGIVIAAVGEREEPWDAFVAHPSFKGNLADVPEGATLATSSLRRQAQIKAWRPDLQIVPVRGNVDTRLEKLDASDWHGLILATAGLVRLDQEARIRERIAPDVMLPAISQGALGIVCAEQDAPTRRLLRERLHHPPTSAAVLAERAFLRRLEGGCQVPIGAWSRLDGENSLLLDGCVASLDGTLLIRDTQRGHAAEPEALGTTLAEALLDQGAGEILQAARRAF